MVVLYSDESVNLNQSPTVRVAIANVGDCRVVLCDKNGKATAMTNDHKPYLPEEKARIEVSLPIDRSLLRYL